MRRAIGRFLLVGAAALPIGGALGGSAAQGAVPARGAAVMKCMYFKGVLRITPGLTGTPTDQHVTAHGRTFGCNGAGGGGDFSASLTMSAATCSYRRLAGDARFAWTDGSTSSAVLTLVPAAVQPRKLELDAAVTDGLFGGRFLHSWVRTAD